MPKPMNMVANTLAAMRRVGDWERRGEGGGAMFSFMYDKEKCLTFGCGN